MVPPPNYTVQGQCAGGVLRYRRPRPAIALVLRYGLRGEPLRPETLGLQVYTIIIPGAGAGVNGLAGSAGSRLGSASFMRPPSYPLAAQSKHRPPPRHRRLMQTPTLSLSLLGYLVHQPSSRLRQRIHQVPDLAWEYLHLHPATSHQEPVPLDLDRQILSHANDPSSRAQSAHNTSVRGSDSRSGPDG